MKCPNCGFENNETANFCINCGIPLKQLILPEKRIVTVIFADLVNFTRISENKDPEDVLNMLNEIFETIEQVVYKYEGFIDKYLGDGVMILFGAPIAHEDDLERAIRCSTEILSAVERLAEDLKEDIKVKISINNGYVISGYTGGSRKRMYTVIGDTVNVAEKINDLAHPCSIVVTERVAEYTAHLFDFKPLGEFNIPGREEPIKLYEYVQPKILEYGSLPTFKGKLVPLVGRKREFERLKSLLNSIESGISTSVSIIGEAGVGKSRMKYEIKKYCKEYKDYIILEALCKSQSKESAYEPFLDIIKALTQIKPEDNKETKRVKIHNTFEKHDIPVNAEKVIQNLLGLDPEFKLKEKLDIFEAFYEIFKSLSQNRPLFLIFEDIHWIDEASLDLLRFLIEKTSNLRIFYLLTYRPTKTILLPELSLTENIVLQNLTKEESEELIKNLLEAQELPAEFVELVYSKTEGNPLFIEELIERIYKDGFFQIKDGKLSLIKNLNEASIPDKITNLFLQEIDKLPPDTKQVAKIASVIGREFSKKILEEIWQREDLGFHLRKLEESGIAYADKTKEDHYIFKHSFVRDAAYNLLLRKEQKELHKKVGEAIEKLYINHLEEFYESLAYHFELSDVLEKALYYNYKSGINLANIRMYSAACSKLRKAEEILEKISGSENEMVDKSMIFDLYYRYAEALLKVGHFNEAEVKIKKAINIATEISDFYLLSNCYQIEVEINYQSGNLHTLIANLEAYKNHLPSTFFETYKNYAILEKNPYEFDEASLEMSTKRMKNAKPIEFAKYAEVNIEHINNIGGKKLTEKIITLLNEAESKVDELILPEYKLRKTKILLDSRLYDHAREEIEFSKNIIKKEYDEDSYVWLLIFDSIIKREQGEFAQAQKLLNIARSIAEDIPNHFLRGTILFNLGILNLGYLGERLGALTNFATSSEILQQIGERKIFFLTKIYSWVTNIYIGNINTYDELPSNLKVPENLEWYKIKNMLEILKGITELMIGDPKNGVNSLKKANYTYSNSEILILLLYTFLLLTSLKKDELLDDLVNRVLFVLQGRTENILDFAHYNSTLLIYHYLKNNMEKGRQIVKQRGDNPRIKAIRESSLIFEFGNIVYNGDIDNLEKYYMIEEILTQLDIIRLPIQKILLSVIQYKLIGDTDIALKESKIKQLRQEMNKYRLTNLVPLIENLHKSES